MDEHSTGVPIDPGAGGVGLKGEVVVRPLREPRMSWAPVRAVAWLAFTVIWGYWVFGRFVIAFVVGPAVCGRVASFAYWKNFRLFATDTTFGYVGMFGRKASLPAQSSWQGRAGEGSNAEGLAHIQRGNADAVLRATRRITHVPSRDDRISHRSTETTVGQA
jgi:hypothetical protein